MTDGIRRFSRDELSPDLQEKWDWLDGMTGQAAFIEGVANAPELLDFTLNDFYGKIFYEGRVERRFKELARLRMSLGHGCRTCNLGNSLGAQEVGYTMAQLEAIEGDRSCFDAAEQVVLALADEFLMQNQQGHMAPALYHRLRAHFDDAQILELGTVMSYLGGLAKLLFVFDLAEKEEYCRFRPGGPKMPIAAE